MLLTASGLIVLALGWVWLWYYAASAADRTLAVWVEREAVAGRVYSCGSQSIGGFPFRIEARCRDAAAELNGTRPPLAVRAKDVVVVAQVYHPTLFVGEVTGPLTVAEPGQPQSFAANWSRAQMSVRGLPPNPDSGSVAFDRLRVERNAGAGADLVFSGDHAEFDGRIVSGSASNNPVIEAAVRLVAARAPTLHPLLAEPIAWQLDAVLRGFRDLSPKPLAERFREMQAAGGDVAIKSMRIQGADFTVVGNGTLTVNAGGKLDGLVHVAIAGIEHIVPLLGLDRLIGQGIDRLTGADRSSSQGLGSLDRLMPGLSGVVRESTNASVIENLKKMGQPAEIDKKPAIVLPLRFSDGSVYLGMVPVGEVPPLF